MYHTLNPLTSVMILKLIICNKSDTLSVKQLELIKALVHSNSSS